MDADQGEVLPGGLTEACAGLDEGTLVEPDERERDALTESYRRFCTELHTRGWIDDELFAVVRR